MKKGGNCRNSNNTTTNNKGWGGSGDRVYSGNTSGGGNKNDLQVKWGKISKDCLVCGDEVHWIKYLQKGQVNRLINTEIQVTTMLTIHTGTFNLCRKWRHWYKKVNKYHHTTDSHQSTTGSSQQQVGNEQGNLSITRSGQNNATTTTSGHMYYSLVFQNNLFLPRIPERGSVKTLYNISNIVRDIEGLLQKFIFELICFPSGVWIDIPTALLFWIPD